MSIFVLLFLHVFSLNVLSLFISSTRVFFPIFCFFVFVFFFFFFEEVLTIIERLLIEPHLLVYNCASAFPPNAASVLFTAGLL